MKCRWGRQDSNLRWEPELRRVKSPLLSTAKPRPRIDIRVPGSRLSRRAIVLFGRIIVSSLIGEWSTRDSNPLSHATPVLQTGPTLQRRRRSRSSSMQTSRNSLAFLTLKRPNPPGGFSGRVRCESLLRIRSYYRRYSLPSSRLSHVTLRMERGF